MPACGHDLSLWIFVLLSSLLQRWDTVTSSETLPLTPPPPSLTQVSSGREGSVVLVCRAPGGHGGTLFRLYRSQELVASVPQDDQGPRKKERQEARFTLTVEASGLTGLYCCMYMNLHRIYSPFSPYLTLDLEGTAHPLLPPVLSVDPPGGQVKRGQSLSFHCSPPPSQQSPRPETFLLLRTAVSTMGSLANLQGSLVSRSIAQHGTFRLGSVRGGEGGSYTCLYQVNQGQQGPANSTASDPVLITVSELLPVPTLSLQSQAGQWSLLCTGSPAYPGALFSLYPLGSDNPDVSRHVSLTRHHALFPLPVQESPSAQYQCQYSARLGSEWSNSERSLPLTVLTRITERTTILPPPSAEAGFDWPLVLGSLSAVVLFCAALAAMGVALQRKVKADVEERTKREAAVMWANVCSKDHTVDLNLKRLSFTSQEWGYDDAATETAYKSPLRTSLSTFGNTPDR